MIVKISASRYMDDLKFYLAASIPSQVDDSLIRILSLEIPACLYRSISFLARAMEPSLSKDSLFNK